MEPTLFSVNSNAGDILFAVRGYTQAQLVSFGNYLLNTYRITNFIERYNDLKLNSGERIDAEFTFQVYDADLANWSEKEGLEYNANMNPLWPQKLLEAGEIESYRNSEDTDEHKS